MNTARDFAVVAPDRRKLGLLFAVLLLVLLVSMGLLIRQGEIARGGPWLLFAMLVTGALLSLTIKRRKVSLADGVLTIAAGLNTARVPLPMLDPDRARIVRLDEHPEFRPGIKTFGGSLPGYQSGHFRQPGGRKVFALLTSRERVLVLPQRDGRLLLLSLVQPQALLDALRESMPRTAHTR